MNITSIIRFSVFFSLSFLLISSCTQRGELKRISYIGDYRRDFNDFNKLHLSVAQKIGINPIQKRKDVSKILGKLEKVESNDYYKIEKLKYSVPFLIPKAVSLLDDIGENFRDSLESLNAPLYKLKVTSVTRTVEDIKKLSRRNYNSTRKSAHQYGTTFDISWSRYIKVKEKDPLDLTREQLKMVFASVLRDLHKNKRCYIKHERKQGCFHITVR